MTPDPVALDISRSTYRSYDEIRRALNLLTRNGWTPFDAERLVRAACEGHLDPHETARVVLALHVSGEDFEAFPIASLDNPPDSDSPGTA